MIYTLTCLLVVFFVYRIRQMQVLGYIETAIQAEELYEADNIERQKKAMIFIKERRRIEVKVKTYVNDWETFLAAIEQRVRRQYKYFPPPWGLRRQIGSVLGDRAAST